MRGPGRRSTRVDRSPQPTRPRRAGPDLPQSRLRGPTGRQLGPRAGEQLGEGQGTLRVGPLDRRQPDRIGEGFGEELVRRPGRRALLRFGPSISLRPAQPPRQSAYSPGVETTEGRREQLLGDVGLDQRRLRPLGLGEPILFGLRIDLGPVQDVGDAERSQQHLDGRLGTQRQFVTGDLDRDVGRGQRSAQSRDRSHARPHQHRHLRPGQAVVEVRPTQQFGDPLGLGGDRRERADLDRAVTVRRIDDPRPAEPLVRRAIQAPGQSQSIDDAPGHVEDLAPEPAGGVEGDHRSGNSDRGREVPWEAQDAAQIRSAEAVDRLVRVADRDQIATVTGERPEQCDLGRIGVLVLVDDDAPEPLAQLGPVRRIGGDQPGAVDELGVVDEALRVEYLEVLREHLAGRDPLRPFGRLSHRGQLVGVPAVCAGLGEQPLHLVGETAGTDRRNQRLGPGDRPHVTAADE